MIDWNALSEEDKKIYDLLAGLGILNLGATMAMQSGNMPAFMEGAGIAAARIAALEEILPSMDDVMAFCERMAMAQQLAEREVDDVPPQW